MFGCFAHVADHTYWLQRANGTWARIKLRGCTRQAEPNTESCGMFVGTKWWSDESGMGRTHERAGGASATRREMRAKWEGGRHREERGAACVIESSMSVRSRLRVCVFPLAQTDKRIARARWGDWNKKRKKREPAKEKSRE
eukprot:6205828-Pleurochrysis_carterae.AAC.1